MRSQFISAAAIALATTFLLPQQAFAQTNEKPASATVAAAIAPAESVTQILPISFSLNPATLASSSAAVSTAQEPTPQAQQTPQPQQKQATGDRHASNLKTWAQWRATRRDAMRWELGYFALSAVDAGQTISCLHAHTCHEVNPIYGRHPSTARIILTKLAGGAVHYWLFKGMNKKNPWEARLAAQLSVGLQGFIVGINFAGALNDN
jgi:hypothetical protein